MMKKQLVTLGLLLLYLEASLVLLGTPVQADPGWINVTAPHGGTWYVGDILNISWNSLNAGNYVDILLYIGEMQQFTITSNFYNSGSTEVYQWQIPNGVPTGLSCRIKIVSTSNQSVYGFSSYFTLNDRYVQLQKPVTGDVWYGGDTHNITWTSLNIGGSIQLSLYQSDTLVMRIAQHIPGSSGTYMWNISTTVNPGTSYKIRIDAVGYPGISSYSGYFSIKKRTIQITSPTQDTTWYQEGIYQITWVSDHTGSSVDIYLYEKKEYEMSYYSAFSIIKGADNDGSLIWTIPSTLTPSSRFRIYITSVQYSDVFNFSGSFQIESRYISVMSPKSNVTWYIGGTYNITWDSRNAGELVNIELYQHGAQRAVLIENTTNNGAFMWRIPTGAAPDGSSQIKIRSSTITSLYGISGFFSLSRRSVEVNSPQGTDLWHKGEHHTILWQTKGFSSNVKIDLCVDAAVEELIAGDVENSGVYDWTVPLDLPSGSQYTIKITSVTDESIYGFSQGHLVIESTFLQQWSGTIILFGVVLTGFMIALVFIIRSWRRRIIAEKNNQASDTGEIVPEQLSDEEYEKIWEQNRD